MIRDQLMVQCKSRKIQERLWAAKNPSLRDAVDMAKVVEELELCMKEMGRGKEQILVVDDGDVNVILEEVGEVFREELGELKGYVHKIRMKQGTVAVKH
ncbi:hypothetical protein NDU88_009043 [Pleurodeles waltl]|uniref:Uncharacterized protein n=1 Tax=Pleurodeles waltl TaxID=8319 RepID=A0AAV7PXX8_PLEWA|nr:hypothetical protein NDU88_009043 [Pleurodeles waltl]